MLFSCVPDGIRYRIVDVSHQATPSACFPVSVGLRSQTLKLRFVSPEREGFFLTPTLPVDEMVRVIEERFSAELNQPVIDRSFIGDSVSLCLLYTSDAADE